MGRGPRWDDEEGCRLGKQGMRSDSFHARKTKSYGMGGGVRLRLWKRLFRSISSWTELVFELVKVEANGLMFFWSSVIGLGGSEIPNLI